MTGVDMSVQRNRDNIGSQQVSWLSVHDFVRELVAQANGYPMAGTPAWSSLTHDDPRKWAALLDAAQHHALRVELAQEALAEASRDVGAHRDDWSAVARSVARGRGDAYIPRTRAS